MTELSVEVCCLNGFGIDLEEVATVIADNAQRYLPGLLLPADTDGEFAALATASTRLQDNLYAAIRTDLTAVDSLRTQLATSARAYRSTDDAAAAALSAGAATAVSDTDLERFVGLQSPNLTDVPDETYNLRATVVRAIEQVSGYDDPLAGAIGMRPAADYLQPLVADWESVQAIGRRIRQLSINDYVAAQNLTQGSHWLATHWSGEAARAFFSTAALSAEVVGQRSDDLEAVAKVVESGGACLEMLVHNQAIGLVGAIMESRSYLGFHLPLGHWAQLVDGVLPDSIEQEISSAVTALRTSADARRTAISALVELISQVMDFAPGRPVPTIPVDVLDIPAKVVADPGVRRYGFGNNVWWEDRLETAAS
ncbi:hypothetical protein [Nocardia caishijiensis]|uniref:Uncharacterized protein n=1 Tax=Nocardia caishijiensis TaxID=184756 RepID=A0ABQ6YJP7_9NOCA|nr:hypothetical protein [Nocardia caishijiensis]KAF0846022.1 hypothetical protein FNL39_106417 [Nocardia caishijiensis]